MTSKKISELASAGTPLAGTETLPITQSGVTVKTTVNSIVNSRTVSPLAVQVNGAGASGAPISANTNHGAVLGVGAPLWGSRNILETSYEADLDGTTLRVPSFGGNTAGLRLNLYGDAVNLTGNFVPKAPAKGIDFTANTPAAGMTSQLLNWYEEGTWTPTFTNCGTVSFTVAKYTRVGRIVSIQLVMLATSITANSSQFTLPIASSCLTSGTFTSGTLQGGFVEAQASTACYFATTMTGTVAPNVNLTYSV